MCAATAWKDCWDCATGEAGACGEEQFLVESRALIILRLALLRETPQAVSGLGRAPVPRPKQVVPIFSMSGPLKRAIKIGGSANACCGGGMVFVVAGYPAIGMGHVFRALMLAHEITSHKITFVCTRESELAVESIARKDYRIVRQGDEDLAGTVLALRPDLVVNDFLNTDAAYMERLRAGGARCVNFEDEGPGAALANLVINALYESGRSTKRLRCGPDYFCLRDNLWTQAQSLRPDVRTVLLTFGGTDRWTARRILDIIEPICRAYGIAVRLVARPELRPQGSHEAHLRKLENPLVEFTWATNVMSRMMEGADLAICSAGRTVYELAHMRVPGMVLAHHEREARHTFARPRNGFAFVGLMDRVDDVKIRNVFLAMLKQARRARFWERQNRLDFTANKARVVGLMLDLLDRDEA